MFLARMSLERCWCALRQDVISSPLINRSSRLPLTHAADYLAPAHGDGARNPFTVAWLLCASWSVAPWTLYEKIEMEQ